MIRNLSLTLVLVFLASFQLGRSQIPVQDTIQTVRYELVPGKRLFYTARSKFEYTQGLIESQATLEIWVIRHNAAGSWQLLLRNTETTAITDERSARVESTVDTSWAACDFSPKKRPEY